MEKTCVVDEGGGLWYGKYDIVYHNWKKMDNPQRKC